jgi:hypothetical protein
VWEEAITLLWDAVHTFEAAGGKTLIGEDPISQAAAQAAAENLLSCDLCVWFKALYEACDSNLDVVLYANQLGSHMFCSFTLPNTLTIIWILILILNLFTNRDTFPANNVFYPP